MRKLLANLKPYWKTVIVLILLLAVQAYADMALPQYTQDIIDVGIQNKGIEHILPTRVSADEYESAQIFMTDSEKEDWQAAYQKDGKYYARKSLNDDKLDSLDDEMLTPLVLTYQMGHTTEKQFKEMLKQSAAKEAAAAKLEMQIDESSIEELEKLFQFDIKTFKAEDEKGKTRTYIDMRPIVQQLIDQGVMGDTQISQAKKQMNETIEKVGSSTLRAMGIAYASECEKAAGVDVEGNQISYLWRTGGRMAAMTLLMLLAAAFVSLLASRVGANIGRDLRFGIFSKVLGFSNAEMDKFSTSSLITRATNDVQQVQMVTTMLLRMVLYAPILGIWGVVKVIQTRAHMSWVIIVGVICIMTLVLILMAVTMPKFKIMQNLVDNLNGVSREILTGLSVIRAFGREKTEEKRFDRANTELMKTQLFTNRAMTMMMPGMMLIMFGLTVLITWVAAHRVDDGTLQVGAMTAFITYAMMIVMSFMILTVMSIILPRAGVAAERIDEVIRTPLSITDAEKAEELKKEDAVSVEFDHVSFRYPGAEDNVIEDISFTAEAGKTTAIIGSTGSGKSTLVNLIPRFYDVTEGRIRIAGKDTREYTLESLRDAIGFVPQKGILFSGTIASNIRFGCEDASDEVVRMAADTAQAMEFIEGKEEKFDSVISQGGDNVSGGQKQRLSIARAIAKQAKILVFDDSFSALDMKTDAKLRQVLAEREAGAAKIIVAQRISTILNADEIIVLDEGRIAGKGTHDELMKNCEVYRQIAESQLSQTELEAI